MTRRRRRAGPARTGRHPGPRVEPARPPASRPTWRSSGSGGRQTITPRPAGARGHGLPQSGRRADPRAGRRPASARRRRGRDRRRGRGSLDKVVAKARNQGATPRSEDADVVDPPGRDPRGRGPPGLRRPRRPSRWRRHWARLGGPQPRRPAISTTSWLTVIELRCRSLSKRLSSFTDHERQLGPRRHLRPHQLEDRIGSIADRRRLRLGHPARWARGGRSAGPVVLDGYGGQLAGVGEEARPPGDRERAAPSAVEQDGGLQTGAPRAKAAPAARSSPPGRAARFDRDDRRRDPAGGQPA